MNQNLRSELIRVIIHVKKIWLAVRFNCKLSFIIKNELSEKLAETDSTHSLFRGECLVNQTIYFEIPSEALSNKCKKFKLIVMMISANGMVPAGFTSFSVHPKSPYEQFQQTAPLQRCQDTRAQIKFMHLCEISSKTSFENSYIHELLNKKDGGLYDNGQFYLKFNPKPSYSVNRQNVSARKHKYQQNTQVTPIMKSRTRANLSRVSPYQNQNGRKIQNSHGQNYMINNQVKRGFNERINEEVHEQTFNSLSKQQLLKQHQEYWLQIIRMEEEVEDLKAKNSQVNTENDLLKQQNEKLKQYYEGHEEKIHAFVGQIQENTQIISKQQDLIAQKQKFEKEYYKLLENQENQKNQNINLSIELNQIINKKNLQIKNYWITIQNLELSLKSEKQKNEILEAELKRKVNVLNQIEQQLKLKIIQVEQQINTNKKHQQMIYQLQRQPILYQQVKKQAQEYQQIISTLKNSQSDQENTIKLNVQTIETDKFKIENLEMELHNCLSANNQLRIEIQRKQDQIFKISEDLKDKIQQLQLKLSQYDTIISNKYSGEVQLLKQKLQEYQNNKINLDEELNNLRHQLMTNEVLIDAIQKQKSELSTYVQQLVSERDSYIIKLNQLEQSKLEQSQILKYIIEEKTKLINEKQTIQSLLEVHIKEQIDKRQKAQSALQQALNQLEQYRQTKTNKDQYQQSYNLSITSLTLKQSKLEKQLDQSQKKLAKITMEKIQIANQLDAKEKQLTNIKLFAQNAIQKQLKTHKEKEQFKGNFNHLSSQFQGVKTQNKKSIQNLIIQCQEKDKIISQFKLKNEQLVSQLQFVSEVLKKQRQESSDIDHEFSENSSLVKSGEQKKQLQSIYQVGNVKEESFDQNHACQVNLELQSNVLPSSEENIKNQNSEKAQKKKKKNKK